MTRYYWKLKVKGYNPDQPRVPAGSPEGGRWTSSGGSPGKGGMPVDEWQSNSSLDPEVKLDRKGVAVLSGWDKGSPSDNWRAKSLYGYNDISDEDRAHVKDEICSELSSRTNLPYDTTKALVKTWAGSAADLNTLSLELQEAAAEEFGLKLRSSVNERLQKTRKVKFQVYDSLETLGINKAQARQFLRTMYDITQERLAKSNIKEITLFRGSDSFSSHGGTNIRLSGNPMQSFSVSPYQAGWFGPVAAMRVPASSIISTARTGFGCLTEGEFVVLVGADSGHTATVLQ